MTRLLPLRANLENLKKQGKKLLRSHKQGNRKSVPVLKLLSRFSKASPEEILGSQLSLQEVQHAIALEYGFKKWTDLRNHIEAQQREMKGKPNILEELEEKGNKGADDVALLAVKDEILLEQVFEGANSSNKRVKNAAAKALKLISETEPAKLYRRFSFFVDLIERDDTILKWIGIDVIGNLSYVDGENKIDKKLLMKLFDFLSDEGMITAAHSVDNLWKMALNRPQYQKEITAELLKVDSVKRHQECHNILAGRRILAFSEYFDLIDDLQKGQIFSFVKGHLNNSRNATKKKAEKFLKKFE